MTGAVIAKTIVNLTTYTEDNSLAATYPVVVTATLSGYPFPALSTSPKAFSFMVLNSKLFIASMTLNAVIGKQAILYLPNIIGAIYKVIGTTAFEALVEGN